ncbi:MULTISPECIES: RNase H family protein [unclassified Vibrio]|uniref:RNase H family protein n=1 Tax=unclassified Vibrio TaxID=2614977 RepID=UPI000B8E33C2|nr:MULTISPECIES: RNase H family protein [unclassified Vibrio]NAW90966.1 ribonuclease H [Vibrio sp. V24_P1S3T111]OXX21931.1 ribonuclease H [Vibrio sp. V06_P1A73T115]OXX26780.1 ribonuclease H [Vibrio sp. V05_P4A8T149]OXX31270.1 ribonuclease H [Vibrio sp. V14_P6S14T42]OXX39097.1 ribonuclease H [Vibrio sp. V04_P4A5T148]
MTQSHYTLYIGVSVNKDKTQGAVGVAIYDEEHQLADSFTVLVDRNVDSTELELTAIVEALRYAFDDDVIYSTSDFCVRGYNEWLDDWKRRGWRKSDKKPVAYRQLWQLVDEERSKKFVDVRKLRSSPELDLAYRLAKEELEGEAH